ncbi:MAG TPA: hypothetical protein PKW24_00850 [Clostridiales bacterium]|jgi:hypothetical protein|nr:hypothetical protein [Clostridiales bacterium]HRT82239.1 hypothetical protein [Oscillospiraceae bacterium]
MTVTEKAAYLKGLAEGLQLDEKKAESKVINGILDLLEDLALAVDDLDDSLEIVNEQVDAVDADLAELEEIFYGDFDEDDYWDDDDGDEEFYEIDCPACGEVICIDEGIIEEGSINCPKCNELLEFDFDCDCLDCCDDE